MHERERPAPHMGHDPIGDAFVIANEVEFREAEVRIDQSIRVRDPNACDDGVIDRCRQLVL
jgi:hypothetical protein